MQIVAGKLQSPQLRILISTDLSCLNGLVRIEISIICPINNTLVLVKYTLFKLQTCQMTENINVPRPQLGKKKSNYIKT